MEAQQVVASLPRAAFDFENTFPELISPAVDWAASVGAYYGQPELGAKLVEGFTKLRVYMVASIKMMRRGEALAFLKNDAKVEHPDLMLVAMERLLNCGPDEQFFFRDDMAVVPTAPATSQPQVQQQMKAKRLGMARQMSFADVKSVIPEGYDPKTAIERLPGIVIEALPAVKLLRDTPTSMGVVTSAINAWLLLALRVVHVSATDREGSVVQSCLQRLATLIVVEHGYRVEHGSSAARTTSAGQAATRVIVQSYNEVS